MMRRKGSYQEVAWMVGGSLIAHTAILVAAIGLARLAPRLQAPPQNAIMTRLVRLGTPRPKELLPVKEETPPPPPAAPPATVAPQAAPAVPTAPPPKSVSPVKVEAAPTSAPQVSAKQRAAALNKMNSALDRLRRETDGEADGSSKGDSNVAVLGDRFMTEVQACVKNHYVIEGTDPTKVANLRAQVLVFVGADGSITNYRIETSSGVPAFDQAVGRAVTRCGRVSAPPAALRQAVRHDGIVIVFTP